MKTSDAFYDRITPFYPLINLFLNPQKRKFFRTINAYPPGQLLEIGVGNGAHLKYYARHDVTAIDSSGNMISRARKNHNGNILLLQMNGEALAFPNESFDYVVLSHVIAVVENPQQVLEEVYRVLRSNGKVLMLNHFTPDNWLRYLDTGFEKISRLLHFKSVFHIAGLVQTGTFTLLSEQNAGLFSYFKILVYEKNV